MSICDKVCDADLEHAVSALRTFANAINGAGMDAQRMLSEAQIDAVTKLSGLVPVGPVAMNGEER